MSEHSLNIDKMLEGSIHRMSHVYRYSSVPVIRRENVAEHSWYVAFYSYLIGVDLVKQGIKVDFGKLLSRALIHDLDESMTGDFLRYVKYGHPDLKKALDEVSVSMIEKMGDELGVPDIQSPWATAKEDDVEGHIIEVVDLARVASYVWEEVQSGNMHVAPILKECWGYIVEFCEYNEQSPLIPYVDGIIQWLKAKTSSLSSTPS